MMSIGDILIFTQPVENPYLSCVRNEHVVPNRREALRMFRDGTLPEGWQAWHLPFGGGARILSTEDALSIEWNDKR